MKTSPKSNTKGDSLSVSFEEYLDGEVPPRPARDDTKIFDSIADALADFPQGTSVLPIGFADDDLFLRAGFRVADSEQDVTIALGGEREFAYARRLAGESALILVPAHDYAAATAPIYRTENGGFAEVKPCPPPYAAVFDAAYADALASSFGEIAALDLCAFDLAFASRMRGVAPEWETENEAAKIVTELTAALKGCEKDKPTAAKTIVSAGKRAAMLVAKVPGLLHCSGAAQMSEATRMLYAAENRPLGLRGEIEFLLAAYVTEFYIKNLGDGTLRFPPDNNRRIDSVCEYFGADVRHACLHLAPVFPPIKMRLYEYRRNEFRAETARALAAVKSRQLAARQVFKRLYDDDGFGLQTLVENSDLGICLALAPDVFASDSMLSFLKQTGRLEEYIV